MNDEIVNSAGIASAADLCASGEPHSRGTSLRAENAQTIAIASTFTADLLTEPLRFWMAALEIPAAVVQAPYAQLMQELLSPESLLASTRQGFAVLLVRLEDWVRDRRAESTQGNLDHIRDMTSDLQRAIAAYRRRSGASLLVFFCPPSAALPAAYGDALRDAERALVKELATFAHTHCWTHDDVMRLYPVSCHEDPHAERIGHIPYKQEYFVAIATLLARRIAALLKPPYKVMAIDCDNTLWKGICGEDGASGVELTPEHLALQETLVKQHDAGVLLCLCSKNNAADVQAVFRSRPEMVLREDHLICSRVNWSAKSSNLQSLARELDLALDSFVLLDDSPVECAEVRAHCPAVLALQVPGEPGELRHFLDHVWAFDRVAVTAEARQRTAQYRQNRARDAALEGAADLQEFLASLQIAVDVAPMQAAHLVRTAELVQRTNQFNLTAVRRRAAEIESVCASGELRSFVVHVRDRFGDYGMVGVLLVRSEPDAIDVDTFVLSCRVLGRGVEQRIMNELGRLAAAEGRGRVRLTYRQTPRNVPAWNFLEKSFMEFCTTSITDDARPVEAAFSVPSAYAQELSMQASSAASPANGEEQSRNLAHESSASPQWHEAAYRYSRVADVLAQISRPKQSVAQPRADYAAPRTQTEAALAEIWAKVLGTADVGVRDDFFDLGGDSVLAVQVIASIESTLGLEISIYEFFEGPTIEAAARKLAPRRAAATTIERAHGSGPAPLSTAQQRLWFTDRLEGSTAYHVPVAVRLRGELDREGLQAALNDIVRRHEALRAVFVEIDGEPMQEIVPDVQVRMRSVDLQHRAAEEREAALLEELRDEAALPFDLSAGPLIRAGLLQLSANEHVLLITMHHIASDGWSIGILVKELSALYEARCGRRAASLPTLPIQFPDYVSWQRQWLEGADSREQVMYWKEHLLGAPALIDLPTDHPRPAAQSHRGAVVPLSLGPDTTERLKDTARRFNLTPAMMLYAAWAIVLARLSGQDDVVIGTPIANRRRVELESLIGFFVNTLAVRVSCADDPTVADLLKRVRETMLGAQAHQDVPFERVVEVLQPARSLGYSPIFQVMLVYHNAPAGSLQLPGLVLSEQDVPLRTAQFDLVLTLQERADGIRGTLNYATDLFDAATISRWAGHFSTVLERMVRDPRQRLSELSLLSEAERRRVLEEFNATQMPYPREKLIHELFEEQVERTPHEVAVAGDLHLTYRQLNCRANQLARYLRRQGVGPDCFVGLCVERGVEMVLGLLGILKAGGAYVPLDPNYPAERLQYMLQDTQPRAVLTQERLKQRLPAATGAVIALDGDWSEIAQEEGTSLQRATAQTSSNLAYVIYTSGSTGQPKGVAIEHRHAVNLICWAQSAMPVEVFEETLHSTSLNFDLSVYECFVPLASGGTLRVVQNALALLHAPASVTLINTVPSAIKAILDSGSIPPTTRVVNLAGEALKRELVERIFAHSTVECVNNLYGPSETTTYSTWVAMPREQGFNATVGRPIANTQIYILDQHHQPVPIGVVGEIYIGGAGVARGYLNRPELTAERFMRDPFSADAQARMYKTGDVGRWHGDGTIEYLGRNDHQVKIRGFRIELGEIEAQLLRHAQVKEAAVLAREDEPGEKRLVAYLVTQGTGGVLSADALREHVKAVLPEHMVPSAFVMLERMPLTSNGKLDRRALPAPEQQAYASRQYEAPQGEVEEILAGIWRSLLRVERAGRHDNFFELGGHSLLIVQMLERLRRVGLSTELRRVFESPTLADLANALASAAVEQFEVPANLIPVGCEAITPQMLPLVELAPEHIERIVQGVSGGVANIQDIYPLAPLQEGILFHHLFDEDRGDTYVLATLLCVSSRQRLDELIAALQAAIDRHDVLRTAVLWEELPRPVQVVCRRAILPVEEVVLDPDRDAMEQVQEWVRPERQRLDIRRAPLLRLQVAADSNSASWYAVLQLHHMTIDHVTLEIITAEIVSLLQERASPSPTAEVYRNHVAQSLAYAGRHDAETFFRGKLGDVDEPTAPFGLLDVHGDGSQIEEAYEEFEPAEAQRVRAQARRLGVSAATLFHAAWALVIAHTSDRDDVVFGSVLLGRLQGNAGAQRILGMFINTLPLRLRLGDVSAKDLVERTQRELVDLLSHEQASLAVAQRCSGVVGSAPLFTALLNYRHSDRNPAAQWSSAQGIRALLIQERTNYPIALSVDDFADGFALTAQTDRHLRPQRMTGYLRTAVLSLVTALEEAPQTPALKLQVLPEAERRRVLEEFNATQMPYPREQLIHELFEEQVRRTPAAIAVTHGGESLTYDELNRRSNQLARHLRERGVNPDQLVGICVGRGVRMAVGLLGILKAGGAYVPLDPSYPAERLQHMLLDAEPGVVLTEDALRPIVPPSAARIVSLDALHDTLGGLPDDNLVPAQLGLASGHLVYVIYTSGSTGRPKGTNMPHRAMVNLVEWHRATFQARAPRVLQFAALSFDVAFQETFSTLCTGGTLVYLDEWVRKDAGALMELLADQRIDRLFLPPLMLQTLADYARATRAGLSGVKDVIVAGEQLRIGPEIVDLFRRLPGTRLHNHYGPTETHVVTALTLSGDPVRWPALPTIGRSIANTRIHILDGHLQPVGIGVVGEIYIAGANVARGYRNRSELDAERFLPDRFGADVESRMYKTGDLGRWRSDGTIEYLGRNDHQVKIRGFRVEMGEIESQLARHPAVREAAVVVRADGRAEKRLVAYVVSRDRVPPGVEELRAHLKATLPEHMVPYAFVFLDAMPLTPSGKLNRGGLPSPEIDSSARSQHEPPRGKTEETLAEIWRELLAVTQVGRHDDFFELGGHSILALQALLQINMRLRCALGVADIYKSPTLQDLASRVAGALVEDPWVDLEREAALHSDIVHMAQTPGATTQAVMLTGATGFIGRFLLAQLLRDTRAIIYCLIRARSKRHASARLRATLLQWDLMSEDFDQRIVCIPADLRQPRLGMDEDTWSSLAQKVDCVYHCATSMNHLETYAMARPANVDAARELLRFATSGRPKLVNYISTLGIFSAAADDPPRVIHEASSIDHERHRASQGYLASKWVAEKLFMMAQSRGIACNIFRLGLAWADARHGRFDELQHVYRVLKTCLLTGYGIKNYRYPMPPTPVDYIARAVVALAERHRGGHGIFHISSSEQMRDGVFERCNEVMGTSLELVPYYDWICEIKRLHGLGRLLPVVPLVEYAFDMDRESFERHQRSLRWVANLRFNLGRTHGELEQAGIAAPVLDDNLLLICLRGMIARDAELQVCIDDGALRTESDAPDQESPALRPYPADRQRDEAKRL